MSTPLREPKSRDAPQANRTTRGCMCEQGAKTQDSQTLQTLLRGVLQFTFWKLLKKNSRPLKYKPVRASFKTCSIGSSNNLVPTVGTRWRFSSDKPSRFRAVSGVRNNTFHEALDARGVDCSNRSLCDIPRNSSNDLTLLGSSAAIISLAGSLLVFDFLFLNQSNGLARLATILFFFLFHSRC